MKSFSDRLAHAITTSGKSKTALAIHCGVAAPAVSRWLAGSEPRAEMMSKVAECLNVSVKWLMVGEDDPANESAREPGQRRNGPRFIPVIGWAHAGEAGNYEELPKSWQQQMATQCQDRKAFAVVLEGDSMEPKFSEGDKLIIQPSEEAYSGCYVVARFTDDGVIFRRLEMSGGRIRMIPLNERYPVTEHHPSEFSWIYPVWGMFRKMWRR